MEKVGLFFYVNGELLYHACPLEKGEATKDFINYPFSHMQIWDKHYYKKYGVDFDCFPRGRVIYRKADGLFFLYHDRCIPVDAIKPIIANMNTYIIQYDEHYTCHICCNGYVTL